MHVTAFVHMLTYSNGDYRLYRDPMESLCILLSCIITPASRSVISISFFPPLALYFPFPLAQSVHARGMTAVPCLPPCTSVPFSFQLLCTSVLHFQHSGLTSCSSYIQGTKKRKEKKQVWKWQLHHTVEVDVEDAGVTRSSGRKEARRGHTDSD